MRLWRANRERGPISQAKPGGFRRVSCYLECIQPGRDRLARRFPKTVRRRNNVPSPAGFWRVGDRETLRAPAVQRGAVMSKATDTAYYAVRSRAEWASAKTATDPRVAAVHYELAARYEALARTRALSCLWRAVGMAGLTQAPRPSAGTMSVIERAFELAPSCTTIEESADCFARKAMPRSTRISAGGPSGGSCGRFCAKRRNPTRTRSERRVRPLDPCLGRRIESGLRVSAAILAWPACSSLIVPRGDSSL